MAPVLKTGRPQGRAGSNPVPSFNFIFVHEKKAQCQLNQSMLWPVQALKIVQNTNPASHSTWRATTPQLFRRLSRASVQPALPSVRTRYLRLLISRTNQLGAA